MTALEPAVETLAENLLASEPFVAFEQAYSRFEADPQTSGLMRKLTQAQFEQELAGTVDQLLTFVSVMLALAVVIALLGIVNTLALSV